jgi:DNA-binding beta-propeller fold protein YncE
MYCGTSTGKLYRLNFSSGMAVLVGTADNVNYWGLSFSPSGKLWASARHDNDSIYIVNTSTGAAKSMGTIGFFAIPRSIAFNSVGALYCLIDNGNGEDYLATLDTLTGAATLVSENPLSVSNLSAIAMRSDAVVSVSQEQNLQLPKTFSLSQNYPNPFNPTTTIRYALPSSANVKLVVYDLLGREIATLVNEEQSAGWKEVQWNATGFASGMYFYRLNAGGFVEVKKMLVVK